MFDGLDWTQLALDIVQRDNLNTIINLRVQLEGSEPLSASQQWLNALSRYKKQVKSTASSILNLRDYRSK